VQVTEQMSDVVVLPRVTDKATRKDWSRFIRWPGTRHRVALP